MRQEYRFWIRWLAVLLAGALILVACVEAPLILSPAQKDLPSQTAALETGSLLFLDGQPLVTGQTLTLTETDPVEWWEQIVKPGDPTVQEHFLGKGSSWEYQAPNEAAMVTVLARSESNEKKVSFTVSPPDVIVAPHVKVLSDQIIVNGKGNGSIRLKKDPSLPSLRVGDVVIGARGEVDPSKVKSIQIGSEEIELVVDPALPKEVIEKGTATFEQAIDWSGSSGEVTLVDIPAEPFHIADDLDPKWEGFVQAGDPIQRGLKVTVSANLDWNPTYQGTVEFDKGVGNGVKSFSLHQTSTITGDISLKMDGFYKWQNDSIVSSLSPKRIYAVSLSLGPVVTILSITSNADLELSADSEVSTFTKFDSTLGSLSVSESIVYDPQHQHEWDRQIQLTQSTPSGVIREGNVSGIIGIAFHPHLELSLYNLESSHKDLRIYRTIGGSLTDVSTDDQSNEFRLASNLQGNVSTIMTGGVDTFPDSFKVKSEESARSAGFPLASSDQFSPSSDQFSPNRLLSQRTNSISFLLDCPTPTPIPTTFPTPFLISPVDCKVVGLVRLDADSPRFCLTRCIITNGNDFSYFIIQYTC